MAQLDGRVAIVTGGGTGIGKGIARAFAREGCRVVIASRSLVRLEATATELSRIGPEVLAVPADVTDEGQVRALFERTAARFGRLDILVNSAGAFEGGPLDRLSLETWSRVLATNVTGTFLCTREAFRVMKAAGGGRIVNIGSIAAQRPRTDGVPYATSKFAVWGLTQAAALDGREHGIAVSCLHPGSTEVERRPAGAPPAAGRDEGPEPMVSVEDVARTALLMVTLPPGTNLLEAIVLPVGQKYLGRG